MSSRNTAFKSLGNAGITVLILRIIGITIALLPTFYLFLAPSPDFFIYGILGQLAQFIGYLSSLLFMIFIVVALSRSQSKLGIIFGIILIVLEFLYTAAFVVFYTLQIEFGVITLSVTFAEILIYAMMGISLLLGICYIIVFVVLSINLGTYSTLRDMKLIIKFTMVFGIFMGLYYIFTGISSIAFIISGSPPDWVLYSIIISGYAAIVFAGIGGLSLIVIATGYILFSKRD